MYSLEINFLKDRADYKPPKPAASGAAMPPMQQTTALIAGVVVAFLAVGGVMGTWFVVNGQNAKLRDQLAAVDSELGGLGAKEQEVQQIEAQIQQLQTQTTFFANIFNTSVKPMSALMQDLRDRLPAGVQLSNLTHQIEQAESEAVDPTSPWSIVQQNMEIEGYARSFDEVNDFVLTLKRSPFFNDSETELITAQLVDNPIAVECDPQFAQQSATCPPTEFQLPKVVEYTIETTVSNVNAAEILADLKRTQAEGLTTRINALEQQGVIQP